MEITDGKTGRMKRKLMIACGVFLLIGIIFLVCSFLTLDFLVDYWWYDALGYAFYFLQRLSYRYLVFLGVTALFFFIFFFNFFVASRYLGTGGSLDDEPKSKVKTYRKIIGMFRTGSMLVYIPLSLVLAIVIALPLFEYWEAFLLFIFGTNSGIPDPAFGRDISYYLFSFPIYSLLQRRVLASFIVLLVGVLFLYWLEHRLLKSQEQGLAKGAKIHTCFLVLAVFLIEIWDFFLQRYELLFTSLYEPLFSGPGYTEMRIILPFIYAGIGLLSITAISIIYFILTRRGIKTVLITLALFAIVLGGRYSQKLPKLANDYLVNPNAISKQTTYLKHNIDATLSAYNLKTVEMRETKPETTPVGVDDKTVQGVFRNIPVWDGDLLNDVYEQLQQLRTYYDFANVDVSHYTVRDNNQQVFLALREMNTDELPKGARNWVNDHLVYTHGYGAVMTPAGQGGDEPMTWFLKGIPLESEFGFKVEQPGVYFGLLENYPYVIVPNDAGEFGYPKGDTNVTENFDGSGGVFISSMFRKLIFANYFKDSDIFFTTKTNSKSKILFRRNVQERIRTITPYLSLDRDPYAVITEKNFYWIQDAYTTSRFYPYSASHGSDFGRLNYIRNSVKIVVNAYNGNVDYYVFDTNDPIINAYQRMYPGLFKEESQMPPEIRSQVRYPKDLFDIQMAVYAKYHQTDPEVFYQQEDIWEIGIPSLGSDKTQVNRSYYLTLNMIDPDRFDFVLVSPVTPKGRANLRAMALVGSDQTSYGQMIVYSFPKGELVYGPAQINSLINQDTMVSQQFTLWDQVGSQVGRGNMIIIPIGKMLVYIQPVYLKSSTALKIPELKRLIMTQGQVVVMERSLEDAYARLIERIKEETGRIDRRFAPLSSQPTPAATLPEAPPPAPISSEPAITKPEPAQEAPLPPTDTPTEPLPPKPPEEEK